MEQPSNCSSSCVKLYLCSNPEDSIVERRALRENVFPRLREHCRCTLGLDVRVVDPFESNDPGRWPDETTRQQLIAECRESSAGPFLLALIGHQYGAASLPATVEVSEFQLLLQESQQAGISTQELERVYRRDENAIPPSYCLRHLYRHACCPQQSEILKIAERAKEEELRKVFQTSVHLCVQSGRMTPERAHSYYRSVLDADLRSALDSYRDNHIARRCLVYVHKVVNARGDREREERKPHLQLLSQSGTSLTEGHLLSELCDSFLPGLITSCKLPVYTTTTECDRRHGYTTARRRSYAESLCLQVHSDLLASMNSWSLLGGRRDSRLRDALDRDRAEQEQLCDILSRVYDIHRPEEQKIRAYVQQCDKQCPLVVTGGPCTGKTVLLAHCAQQIESWLPDLDPIVIKHFCNLSMKTTSKHVLSSLCYQAAKIYHSNGFPKRGPGFCLTTDAPVCPTKPRHYDSSCSPTSVDASHYKPTTKEKVSIPSLNRETAPCCDPEEFHLGFIKPNVSLPELKDSLSSVLTLLPSPGQPLFLILDGLDEMENDVSFPILESLPSPLPPDVKLILAVSSKRTHILQAVALHYPECIQPHSAPEGGQKEPGYVSLELGSPDRRERLKLLASLLRHSGRTVTSGQQVLVNAALTSCCLTLYARLLHGHTSLWHSDEDVHGFSLPDGVHSSISALLDRCEQKHGSSVVTSTASYLTLSRTGLTEAELADLLSSDDRVLVGYVRQGERPPSSMRVPQVDLEGLLLDLRRFLIRRMIAGSDVLLWVSRHFKLVATKKYLDCDQARREVHSQMADYFSGRWACGNAKPLSIDQKSDDDGEHVEAFIDRMPCSQPFVFTSSCKDVGRVNLRKVLELPYHLRSSARWEELERGLLLSLGFHDAMVRAGLLGELVEMLEHGEGSRQFRFVREKLLLASVLKRSARLLQRSPLQLPAEMETSLLPYLKVFPVLEEYVDEIRQGRKRKDSGLGATLCPAPSAVPFLKHSPLDANAKVVSVAEAAGTECGIAAELLDDGSVWVWKSSECGVAKLSLSCEQEELAFAGLSSNAEAVLLSTRCNKLFLWGFSDPTSILEVKTDMKSDCGSPVRHPPNKPGGFVACQEKILTWWLNESSVSMFDVVSETVARFRCRSPVTCLACSTDGACLYCGLEEGAVSAFDIETTGLLGTCSNSHHNAVTLIILCEDKREMACVDTMGNIALWDLPANTQPPRLVRETCVGGQSNMVSNADYSRDNNVLLMCQAHQVSLWETSDWEMLDQFPAPGDKAFTQAVLSRDGRLFLALLDGSSRVLVWRVSTGECVLSLESDEQPQNLLRTASDVICVSPGGCLTVWDSEMIDAAGTAPKMHRGVRDVLVEPSGEWFYTTDGSEAVWRWNVGEGMPHENFLHSGPVEKLRLSMNGVHLVSLAAGELYVWLTETGLNTLRVSASSTTDVLITPNCNVGVSISERELTRVWKLASGSTVCSIHLHLSDAQVSPESTFLIGRHRSDLLAASLWSGSISKRFSCVKSSEPVVAFHTLSEHADFVVVLGASGAAYTWNVLEDTACRQFQLPYEFRCRPQDFQVSADGGYALLSAENEAINILDLRQVRLCSLKAEGPVVRARLDRSGHYAVYVSNHATATRPVLTAVRLTDGERVGSVRPRGTPTALVVGEPQRVFVGFEDGSVGVYSLPEVMGDRDECIGRRELSSNELKRRPFDGAPVMRLPLATPSVTWP